MVSVLCESNLQTKKATPQLESRIDFVFVFR